MNVALCAPDSLHPNAALMKAATYYRGRGDDVGWFSAIEGCDLALVSRIFHDDCAVDAYLPTDALVGGPGFDPAVRLPMGDLDATMPAYDLYPTMDYSLGRVTRGCPRGCPWCIVSAADGKRVHPVADVADFWNGHHKVVRLLDDNILALPDVAIAALDWAVAHKVRLDFDALDARLITPAVAAALRKGSVRDLHLSFDRPEHEMGLRRGVAHLLAAGFSASHIRVYVLVGFDTTEEDDMMRLDVIRSIGTRPFVMPFVKDDPYQRRLARWANRPQLFQSCTYADFCHGTGTTPEPRPSVCPTCGGAKRIHIHHSMPDEVCPTCHGTGMKPEGEA